MHLRRDAFAGPLKDLIREDSGSKPTWASQQQQQPLQAGGLQSKAPEGRGEGYGAAAPQPPAKRQPLASGQWGSAKSLRVRSATHSRA
jgi:hypothetical protein